MTSTAVFIDKDGTLIDDIPYNTDPEKIRLAPGVASGLALLRTSGFRLFVISNQPGVALGLLTPSQLHDAYGQINHLLAQARPGTGALLDGFYYCPHAPDHGRYPSEGMPDSLSRGRGCDCRKPAPGMLRWAAAEHGLQLRRSWMIGDILDDIEAGYRAGCRTVLIANGNETEWRRGPMRMPTAVVSRFDQAAALVHQAIRGFGDVAHVPQ